MKTYLDLLTHIKDNGLRRKNRTSIETLSIFGYQMRFNLQDGFPLLTTKKMFTKGIIYELLWFLRGDTNIKYLQDANVHIWDKWADENGNLGPVYGKQWRKWSGIDSVEDTKIIPGGPAQITVVDQIANVIGLLQNNPDSRRIIVSAWNPPDIPSMALPPCHCLFHFNTRPTENGPRALDCLLYQRSCDTFLGVPFNIASYALLTMMISNVVKMVPGEFIWTGGDVHLYTNHLDQVDEQLSREPYPLPKMKINETVESIDDYQYDDFKLENYQCYPTIKAPIAV